MPRPPQASGRFRRGTSRSSAEARYRNLRDLAFQEAAKDLAATGTNVELRPIDAAALAAFDTWHGRRVAWSWPGMVANWRNSHPNRFELAVWSGGTLCALALGRPAPSAAHMSLHYIEGNPNRGEILGSLVAATVITALETYAITLGKTELRLVDPLPALIPYYCSLKLRFELVSRRREAPYCRRSI